MQLEPGDSGSPVLDDSGKAVGIVTFVVVDKDMPESPERINFAMPIRHVARLLEQLKNDGKL
jgi:S1-C subfamily serine protease